MIDETNRQVILAVDDTPINLNIIKAALGREFTIKAATSGPVALKIARSQQPDLILLDIMMPDMDGYEVCRLLRDTPDTRDIPIIFTTALSEVDDEVKGLELGAVDYISKPINPAILRARVRTQLALRQAQAELQQKNRRLQNERETVESIVVKMRSDSNFDNRHLRYLVSPVEETNGDILLSAFRPDGTQHLLLGDFTGHGLPAAIGGPLVSHLFYSMTDRNCAANEIIAELNEVLCRQLPANIFLASALVEIAPARDSFKLWNAGLQNPLVIHQDGKHSRYDSTSPPLGIISHLPATDCHQATAIAGERLYLFSDGIIESTNSDNEMFGYDRLEHCLAEITQSNSPLEQLLKTVEHFSHSAHQTDDITLVELQF